MSKIIIVTPEELESIIQTSIRNALREISSTEPKIIQNEKRFLNIEEASSYLYLAKQTLYGYTAKREIPFIKKSKRVLFEKSALDNWLLEGRRKSRKEILEDYENGRIQSKKNRKY